VQPIKERLRLQHVGFWWLVLVLGIPLVALTVKHGYETSLRDGDYFLFNITALVTVAYDWVIEQPASRSEFFRERPERELGGADYIVWIPALLGFNFWFFAFAPGHDESWVLNTVFWGTFFLTWLFRTNPFRRAVKLA
jgi:hypothetical protein